mgnify:CR=1 FL=1
MSRLFEMANLRQSITGLPMMLWVDEMGSDRNVKHNTPRLKFQNNYSDRRMDDLLSISISETPRVLTKNKNLSIKMSDLEFLKSWISSHYGVLIDHWNGKIDTDDLKRILQNE